MPPAGAAPEGGTSGHGIPTINSAANYSERYAPRNRIDESAPHAVQIRADLNAVLVAQRACADLQALLANGVPLTGLASRYVGELLWLIELGLEVTHHEGRLLQRAAA